MGNISFQMMVRRAFKAIQDSVKPRRGEKDMPVVHLRKIGLALSMLLLLAAFLLPGAAVAAPAATTDIAVKVNGQAVTFDVKPVIDNGRTLVPLRGVFEKLGAQVDWLPATREAVITDSTHTVRVQLGSNTATVDGKTVTMDVVAKVVSGRTMVPLRFLSESIGAKAIWVGSTRTVEILDPNKLTPQQKQLLAAYENIPGAHKANLTMDFHMKSTAGDQAFNIAMQITSKAVINNDDRHLWLEMKFSGSDTSQIPSEPLTMEVIKKGSQIYTKTENDPWQTVDQNQLDIPLGIAGDPGEQFLQYYNLPFKVQNNVEVSGQQTTQYSFTLDPKTSSDMLNAPSLQNNGVGSDQDLFNIFKGMTGGAVSKSIYLDSQNRIIQDNTSTSMSIQPAASGQPGDLTGLTSTSDIELSYDYTGAPEPIAAPAGVFPGV